MEYLNLLHNEEVYRRASAIKGQPLLFPTEGNGLFHLIQTFDGLLARLDPQEPLPERQEKLQLLMEITTVQYRWEMPPLRPSETAIARRARLNQIWHMFLILYYLQQVEKRLPEDRLPIDPNPLPEG